MDLKEAFPKLIANLTVSTDSVEQARTRRALAQEMLARARLNGLLLREGTNPNIVYNDANIVVTDDGGTIGVQTRLSAASFYRTWSPNQSVLGKPSSWGDAIAVTRISRAQYEATLAEIVSDVTFPEGNPTFNFRVAAETAALQQRFPNGGW